MEFDDFKRKCMITANKSYSCYNLLYASNALCGESGEFANLVKKIYGDDGKLGNLEALKSELFDVLWYTAYICDVMGWTYNDIFKVGFDKIYIRHGVDVRNE